jgi:hypothetical protein
MGLGPKAVQLSTPSHGLTGWGAFHLNSPTGGAAKGIPLKTWMPEEVWDPLTAPSSVVIVFSCPFTRKEEIKKRKKHTHLAIESIFGLKRFLAGFRSPRQKPYHKINPCKFDRDNKLLDGPLFG